MASAQSEKPYDQSKLQQIENSTYHHRSSTSEIRHGHNKNNSTNTHEHTLSDKVKDMANSARKLFNHHDDHHHHPDHTHKPNTTSGAKTKTETNKKNNKIVKHTQGHEGNCVPKMLDHVKNLKKKNNNKKEKKHSDSSDSD